MTTQTPSETRATKAVPTSNFSAHTSEGWYPLKGGSVKSESLAIDPCLRRGERVWWIIIGMLFAFIASIQSAHACSMSIENRKVEFNYDAILPSLNSSFTLVDTNNSKSNPESDQGLSTIERKVDESESIYLARVEFRSISGEAYTKNNRAWVSAVFLPIETIKGEEVESLVFSTTGEEETYVIDPEKMSEQDSAVYKDLLERIAKQANAHITFPYWDHFLSIPATMPMLPSGNSCGPRYVEHFDASEQYLIFVDSIGAISSEPVIGKNDPLIQHIKNRSQSRNYHIRKTITAESYFRNMEYGVPFRLDRCSEKFLSQNSAGAEWKPFSGFSLGFASFNYDYLWDHFNDHDWLHDFDEKPERVIEVSPLNFVPVSTKKVLKWIELDWPSLFTYYPSKQGGISCSGNEEYLAYGYQNLVPQNSYEQKIYFDIYGHVPSARLSPLRFAKIKEGKVIISSVQTNYHITGPDHIPLSTVLSWVPNKIFFDPFEWPL